MVNAQSRKGWFGRYRDNLARRSEAIPPALERLAAALTIGWAGVFLAFAALRVLASPRNALTTSDWLGVLVPYGAIALAPLIGFAIGEAAFPLGSRTAPGTGIVSWGRWRRLAVEEARVHRLFGPAGFMASLLVGLLLNVVLRSIEFLLAMPAIGAEAPEWSRELFLLMAGATAVMAFFYMAAFAFALHTVSLFPRLLAFCWTLDVFVQLLIAQRIERMEGLPVGVAAALGDLLWGNIAKVLISAFLWLPYLTLSERVNVTYRHRVSESLSVEPGDEAPTGDPDEIDNDHSDQSV